MCHNSILRYSCGHQSIGRYTVTCLDPSTCSGAADSTHFFNVEIRCPDCDPRSNTLLTRLGGITRPDPQTVIPDTLLTFPLPYPNENFRQRQSTGSDGDTTVDDTTQDLGATDFPPPRRSSPRLTWLSQSPPRPSSHTPHLSTTLPTRDPRDTDRGVFVRRAGTNNDTEPRWYGSQPGDMGPGRVVGARSLPPLLPPIGLFGPRGMLTRTRNQPPLANLVAESTDDDTEIDAPLLSRQRRTNANIQQSPPTMVPYGQIQNLSATNQDARSIQPAPLDPWEELQAQYAIFHAEQVELDREEHGRRQDEERKNDAVCDFADGN